MLLEMTIYRSYHMVMLGLMDCTTLPTELRYHSIQVIHSNLHNKGYIIGYCGVDLDPLMYISRLDPSYRDPTSFRSMQYV